MKIWIRNPKLRTAEFIEWDCREVGDLLESVATIKVDGNIKQVKANEVRFIAEIVRPNCVVLMRSGYFHEWGTVILNGEQEKRGIVQYTNGVIEMVSPKHVVFRPEKVHA